MIRRWRFNTVAAFSLLLCLAVIAYWGKHAWSSRHMQFTLWNRYDVVPDKVGIMVWPRPKDRWKHPEPVAFVPYAGAALLTSVMPILWVLLCLHGFRRRNGSCPRCGYNLTGNLSGVCPECGTRVIAVKG